MTREIHQMLPCLSYEDAIGNYCQYLRSVLRRAGYRSEIYCDTFHPRLAGDIVSFRRFRDDADPGSVVLYHFSVGSPVTGFAASVPRHRVLIYHNITPARYFLGVNDFLVAEVLAGRHELAATASAWQMALCDSSFNAEELRELGYQNTHRLGIPLDLARYSQRPSPPLLRALRAAGGPLILCVGRVTPNKGVHHVIRAFARFKRRHEPRARLAIVGLTTGFEPYHKSLRQLIRDLAVGDVTITGHIELAELLAYYCAADVLCCLSEHEGFCVPLIEAMVMNVPILAYRAGAVPETLGGAGMLVDTLEPLEVAELLARLVRDTALRASVLSGQRARLHRYRAAAPETSLWRHLSDLLGMPIGPVGNATAGGAARSAAAPSSARQSPPPSLPPLAGGGEVGSLRDAHSAQRAVDQAVDSGSSGQELCS
ncbi:MAG: glycosyltransferase family 4 protein [Candidatus Schekmanbacteria bacterium]|nr:glycosyltransferase family 4 protein [Candidatus Schekmanbacteria bacterium]